MENLNRGRGVYLFIPVIIYIILYFFIREHGLINDELSLYNFLYNIKLEDLYSIKWTDTFKFAKIEYLNDTQYYRPVLNYIYAFGFWIYEKIYITPLVINWLSILILGVLVSKTITHFTEYRNSELYSIIYLLMPFNFEAALFFPNLSDLLVQIIIFSSILLIKSNYKNKIKYIFYFLFVILGFLIKEASLILLFMPFSILILDSLREKRRIKDQIIIHSKFILKFTLVFIIAFILYYTMRSFVIETSVNSYRIVDLIFNSIKGAFNFLFFTQDINLVAIESILLLYLIYLIFKNKIYKYVIFSYIISIPVAMLLPDERFFHISYFTLLLCLIIINNSHTLKIYLLIALFTFTYKIYSTYEAMNYRTKAKQEFENMYVLKNQLCVSLLPYRIGNESEVFYNGVNFYLENNNIIPVLLKQSLIYRPFKVTISNSKNKTMIETNSKIVIPQLKGNEFLYSGLLIKIIDDNKLIIENINNNNYIIFNSFTN